MWIQFVTVLMIPSFQCVLGCSLVVKFCKFQNLQLSWSLGKAVFKNYN